MDLNNLWSILFLLAEVGLCSGDELTMPTQLNGVRGKSVNFTATGSALTNFQALTMMFTPLSGPGVPLFTATLQQEKVTDSHKARLTFYKSPFTVQLQSLTAADSGNYLLTVIDPSLNQQVAQTALQVLEPVADVSITSNVTEAVETNSTVILTCIAKGSSLQYSWLNNSVPVVADGRHIVQKDNQLIINAVYRTDLQGPISCTAKNQLESSTSNAFNLTVNYGPELITKKQDPVTDVLKKGSNLTLSCSAISSPPAQITWMFNQVPLPQKTSTVVLTNLGEVQSGNYSCMAYNSKTLRSISSDVITLSVIEPILGAKIIAPTSALIAGNSTANLTCTASMGKADSIEWFKQDKPLDTNRIILTPDKSTVTILTVQKEDAGDYECLLKNKVSLETSKYRMRVSYGPENMEMKGVKRAILGQAVQLNCTFSSDPTPTFVWMFNGTVLQGETRQCYTISSFDIKNSGIYICEAFNNVTGLRKTVTHSLTLKDINEPDSEGLSSGAIAGIVIAVLLVLAILICVCCCRKRKAADITSPY